MNGYRVVELEQKSEAWKQWRNAGIGASDAPIVLDLSPYTKPLTLWEIKVGFRVDKPMNSFVEERAKKVEDAARAWLELEVGRNYPAICIEDEARPWLKASLDGFCQDFDSIMEAKWVGADKVTGKIPAHHWIQMQHQLAVSRAIDCVYIRSNDGVRFYPTVVQAHAGYINMLLREEEVFWDRVTLFRAPENKRRQANWLQNLKLPTEVALD